MKKHLCHLFAFSLPFFSFHFPFLLFTCQLSLWIIKIKWKMRMTSIHRRQTPGRVKKKRVRMKGRESEKERKRMDKKKKKLRRKDSTMRPQCLPLREWGGQWERHGIVWAHEDLKVPQMSRNVMRDVWGDPDHCMPNTNWIRKKEWENQPKEKRKDEMKRWNEKMRTLSLLFKLRKRARDLTQRWQAPNPLNSFCVDQLIMRQIKNSQMWKGTKWQGDVMQ